MVNREKIVIRVGLGLAAILLVAGVSLVYKSDKIEKQESKERHENTPTIEGKVIGKTFVDGWGDNDDCSIGVELPNGSRLAFSYFGNEAREMNALCNKGDTIRFKEGYKP